MFISPLSKNSMDIWCSMDTTDCSILGDDLIYPRDLRLNFRFHFRCSLAIMAGHRWKVEKESRKWKVNLLFPSACVLDTRKKLVAAARWQADRLVAVGDNTVVAGYIK